MPPRDFFRAGGSPGAPWPFLSPEEARDERAGEREREGEGEKEMEEMGGKLEALAI